MLREINAAQSQNTAANFFSQSQLTIRKMPPKEFLLSEINAAHQPETDRRTVGVDTGGKSVMDNFVDYRA